MKPEKTFVIYEIWTRSFVVKAADEERALDKYLPLPTTAGLALSNWHAVEVKESNE